MNQSEAFLYDQIPPSYRPFIPATLKTAYAAAARLVEAEPILQVQSALDGGGRIIQWAVDLGFQRLVQSGQWSAFDCRWQYFEHPTGRYLEIRPSHSAVTISQIADPKKQPRDVKFRANKRFGAQGWLRGLPDPEGDERTEGLPHILLVHGHQGLNFAHLGIPHENHKQGYRFRTSNLMLMPYEAEEPEHTPEDTDYEAVMTLKEEIDKWRTDHGA